ncbi:MAG: TlyA family RNA methyltransferase [Clostridia bacterium]|nr:TlyA family RNA methyltransferase [Clostridia bacterium]
MRLDLYLVQNELYESRNKAAAAVKDGYFTVNGKLITKPAFEIGEHDVVKAAKEATVYVARSAHKLLRAFCLFSLNCKDKVAADLGASTGGFCQVLLENDIKKIYAVDIGTAQLHPTVKNDCRVVNMEHTNARYLTKDSFPEPIQFLTADLSFISLKAILPAIAQTIADDGEAIVLVKPQFEAGPAHLSKRGVVLDRKVHVAVLNDITAFAQKLGFAICGLSFSGLAGESGNREYLLYLNKSATPSIDISAAVRSAVYLEESNA